MISMSLSHVYFYFPREMGIFMHCYHHLKSEFKFHSWQGLLDIALSDKVCPSPGTLVCSTSKTDHHDIAKILLNVALHTMTTPILSPSPPQPPSLTAPTPNRFLEFSGSEVFNSPF